MEYKNCKYFGICDTTNLTTDIISRDREFIYKEFKKKKYDKKRYAITHGLEGIRADSGYSFAKIRKIAMIQDDSRLDHTCPGCGNDEWTWRNSCGEIQCDSCGYSEGDE